MVERLLASFEASETISLTGTGTIAFDEGVKQRGARSVRFLLPAATTARTAIILATLPRTRRFTDASLVTLLLRVDNSTAARHLALAGSVRIDLRDEVGDVFSFTGATDPLSPGKWDKLSIPLTRFTGTDLSSVRQIRVTITGSAAGLDCAGRLDYITAVWLNADAEDIL